MKNIIPKIIFITALLCFLISATFLISYFLQYKKGSDIYKDINDTIFMVEEQPAKTISAVLSKDNPIQAETEPEPSYDQSTIMWNYKHDALLDVNPDAVGYLQIPATNTLLPIVQGQDNVFYLSHAVNKSYAINGSLFIDYRQEDGLESQNCIIYGHNTKDGSMFGSLKKFSNTDILKKDPNNKYIYIYCNDSVYKYEIYSVHTAPVKTETYTLDFPTTTDFHNYLNDMVKLSYYTCSVDLSKVENSITLSTCTNKPDVRLVVQAARIDTFYLVG